MVTKLKTKIVAKFKDSNCFKKNSKTQILTTLNNSFCDKTQKVQL